MDGWMQVYLRTFNIHFACLCMPVLCKGLVKLHVHPARQDLLGQPPPP